MPDFRVYSPPQKDEPKELRLSAEESHHLVVVNRARKGVPVIAFDGRGTEWRCELIGDSKNAAVLAVKETVRAAPLPFEITLAQALPKGPAMDAIVRKATEIGARRIIPVSSERTQVHLDDDRQEKKVEKWQTAALEAAKQCGNPWLPEITAVQPFSAVVAQSASVAGTATDGAGGFDLRLIASLHPGATSLKQVLNAFRKTHAGAAPRRAMWLIGPEGDFSSSEVNTAVNAGFLPITLGPLVLRCETAATYALSVLSYELTNG
jgi:16S rRNA (uracil1498-N3)-methyltransferase